ncbi:ribulose-phosphate 3-epimerase [Natronospora cellulosivora (SeqCode)]
MTEIAPSILAADFSKLKQDISKVEKAKYLHLDIMDGHFVPNISFGPGIVKAIRPHSNMFFDTHLMIYEPEKYIQQFADAGSDIITIQVEAVNHLDRVIHQIKDLGCQAGLSLNPATPLSVLDYIIQELDQVLIMTVNPGFGGQTFIPQMKEKIKTLREMIDDRGLDIRIEIDGGVNLDNILELKQLGVDLFVLGSSIFKTEDPEKTLKELYDKIN